MFKEVCFKLSKVFVGALLFSAWSVFAANFSITPNGTLPTEVSSGQSVDANFTVTNLTNSARNGYVVQGLPATVSQNTSSPNCGNPINLTAGASCNLLLTITGAVSSKFALCKENSCTLAATSLNVSLSSGPGVPKFAYITQFDSNNGVIVCNVDSSNGILSNCGSVGEHSVLDGTYPQGISINNAGTIAYLTTATYTPYAYQCTIDRSSGQFSSCESINITSPTNYAPSYGMLTLNTSNTTTFIVDGNNFRILACPISNGTISSTCSNTGATGGLNGVSSGIVLNNSNTRAYIGNFAHNVLDCVVNGSTFGPCTEKTGDGTITFSQTGGVALNSTGTILYISDYGNNKVYGCVPTSTSASEFSHCFVAADITYAWGITLNAQNTVAYVTDYTHTISICPILSDGTFSTCETNNHFNFPVDVGLLY